MWPSFLPFYQFEMYSTIKRPKSKRSWIISEAPLCRHAGVFKRGSDLLWFAQNLLHMLCNLFVFLPFHVHQYLLPVIWTKPSKNQHRPKTWPHIIKEHMKLHTQVELQERRRCHVLEHHNLDPWVFVLNLGNIEEHKLSAKQDKGT